MLTPLPAFGCRDHGALLPWSLAALVAVGTALVQSTVVAKPISGASVGGLIILDNCDPVFRGKEAYGDNLTHVDPAGKVRFRLTGFNNSEGIGCNRRVAVDSRRGWIWTLEDVGRQVRKFDRTGKELLSLKDIQANALAVDPETGNLWVLTSKGTIYGEQTVVFSPNGKRLAVYNVSGWDIAYDKKAKTFWIAEKKLTKVTTAKGEVVCSAPISLWCASSVDVDPRSGDVWVAVRKHFQVPGSSNRLLKFDANGKNLVDIDLEQKMPFRVSVDPKDGSVWVAHLRESVERFSADGQSQLNHTAEALAVQVDRAGGDAWVVTSTEVQRLTPQGDVTTRVKHAGKTSQAWVAPLE